MPPLAGERWWRQPPKGECISSPVRAVVKVFHKRAPSINVRRPPQPSAAKPLSNLRTLGAIAPSNFRTLKPHGGLSIRRRTSPAQRYYITPEGESPQPACKAKPITGRILGAQGQRPGGAINPRPRKTTVGRLNGRPFYEQAKGQLRPTCTSYAGCAHQPSGILESTAPIPIQIPTPTAPTSSLLIYLYIIHFFHAKH